VSAQYDNTNSGLLAKNDRRNSETHPTHTGSVQIICPHCAALGAHFINAWVNEGKPGSHFDGKKYFSLKFKPKDQQPSRTQPSAAPRQAPVTAAQAMRTREEMAEFDDSIPFAILLPAVMATLAAATTMTNWIA